METRSKERERRSRAALQIPDKSRHDDRGHKAIEPALSPTITRKLSRVIPANLQIDARWDAIRKAREAAKKKNGKNAPSPSAMIAWAVVRAMEKHAPFRRLILEDERIVENEDFDLGIAVALDGDRLATAVMTEANRKSWKEFAEVYRKTVDETRSGRVDAMNAPVVISSLGAFGVRAAAPIVVPPSVGTLFIGSAHREIVAQREEKRNGGSDHAFPHLRSSGCEWRRCGQFRARNQGANRAVQLKIVSRGFNRLIDSPPGQT